MGERTPARRPAALMGLHSHSRPTEGSRCQQRVQRPGSEPQQKADTPEPSSLFPASSQRPKGHWGGNRLLEPGKQSHGPSERQGGGASQVLGPWGHEAAFAQTPIKAQGGCAEKAGASHGKRVSSAPSSGISRPVKEGNTGEAQGRWRGPTGHGFREVGQGVVAGLLEKGRPSERPCPNRTIRSPPPSLQL